MANQDFISYRKELAQQLLSSGISESDRVLQPDPTMMAPAAAAAADLGLVYPGGLGPRPEPRLDPPPATNAPLPKADVVVITWTVDEQRALCDVLTPKVTPLHWYRYDRNFINYESRIRDQAPAKYARRLGSYYVTRIGVDNPPGQKAKTVLCVKSELHLNQDGITKPPFGQPGNATLPVRDFFHQIIDEAAPRLVITTGTAGAVFHEHDLGDVVVTRGAKFRVQSEFKNAPFAHASYRSNWQVPTTHFQTAQELMARFKDQIQDPPFLPPTINYAPVTSLPVPRENAPDIKLDGRDLPEFHPILTTDFFEFGTSKNKLDQEGCAVEMGDAVLGLVMEDRKAAGKSTPDWLVIRNCSDPQINGDLRDDPASQSLQAMWAVYFYKGFGYWTSVMSAITTWAVIAGL